MENFDNIKWRKQPANAPEGMYEKVRERVIQERLRGIKTQRHLVVGVFLLLIVAGLNIGMSLFGRSEKTLFTNENKEQILYKTYFNNTLSLDDEK
jgi:hypothetical protein